MPTIRISDKSLQRLKAWAEPLEDSADSALAKALDAAERYRETQGPEPAPPAAEPGPGSAKGPKLPQKAFREPLLEAIYELGGSAPARDVRPVLKERMKPRLRAGDYEQVSSGDERWWNAACWERNDLVKEGYLRKDSPRGVWALSDVGVDLVKYGLEKQSESFVEHLLAFPEGGEDSDFEQPRSGPRPLDP